MRPPPCGFCFPTSRTTHSFYYGTATTPLPAAIPFFDGRCNAELVWDATFSTTITSVRDKQLGESESALPITRSPALRTQPGTQGAALPHACP